MTIMAPGGAVSLKTFAVYSAGAGIGVMAMGVYGLPALPQAAYNWSIGPVGGMHVWLGIGAVLGAALAAKVADMAK